MYYEKSLWFESGFSHWQLHLANTVYIGIQRILSISVNYVVKPLLLKFDTLKRFSVESFNFIAGV